MPENAAPPTEEALSQAEKRLLTKAAKEPKTVLRDGRFSDPLLTRRYFDICDNQALTDPRASLDYAAIAVEHAVRSGDPHLFHLGLGVQAHAFMSIQAYPKAGELLARARRHALGCCEVCRRDWLRRKGDFLTELRDPEDALLHLDGALREPGGGLDADTLARIHFVRAIAHHHRGSPERALADARQTLEHLPLDAPRGYFLDTLAFIPYFLPRGDPRLDAVAVELLEGFKARLEGERGWSRAFTFIQWVLGQLRARGHDLRDARKFLKRAHTGILDHGMPREVVGLTVDLVQLMVRRGHQPDLDRAEEILEACKERPDVRPELRAGLEESLRTVKRFPENAFRHLAEFRASFKTPVPGLLADLPEILADTEKPRTGTNPARG